MLTNGDYPWKYKNNKFVNNWNQSMLDSIKENPIYINPIWPTNV